MIAAAADEHAQVLPQDLDEDRRRIFRVERHCRRVIDGHHVGRDPHMLEQLAHDLLGDFLLGLVDPVDVAHAFGHGSTGPLAGRRPAGGRPVARYAPRPRLAALPYRPGAMTPCSWTSCLAGTRRAGDRL